MNIPFFNYPALFKQYEAEFAAIFLDVGRRGAYIMQRDLEEFEHKLEAYLGVKHAIGSADGTMALIMALMASGVKEGDEVIVPSHTFVASAASIHHCGAKPVLVECAADHLIDPDRIEEAIGDKTTAIMPVQLNGRVADMDKVMAIAKKHGLKVIEDSCQALGAKFKGQFAGTFGEAGTFSFFPAKTLGCFGDGGAMITNSDEIAVAAKEIRDHGRGASGKVERWGFNARLDNFHAAILSFKLDHYDEDVARRRAIASRYDEQLGSIAELLLPPMQSKGNDHFDVYQNYEIEADDRDGLRAHLSENGIGTILQWGGHTIHQFDALGLNDDLPFTEQMTKKFMLLPLHAALSDEEVDYICKHIQTFYR